VQEYSGPNAYGSSVFSSHVKVLAQGPSAYIVQDMPLVRALLSLPFALPTEYDINKFPGVPIELVPAYASLIRQKAIFFTDFSEWMQFTRRGELSFGMRLHGNMAAFQSGVPALVVTHDLRTSELTRHMGIPNVSAQEFLQLDLATPRAILSAIQARLPGFDARRAQLASSMLRFLETSGVPASPQLQAIAAGTAG
jgi:hypothetical protein